MKVALIVAHGSIEVRDVPAPRLGPYDALCEMLYGATCTGTDSHIVDGSFPWVSPLPTVLGHESVGRVIEVGEKVRHFRIGDLITRVGTPASPSGDFSITWGGFCELGVATDHWAMCADGLPREQWQPHRVNQVVPPAVDPRHAPMFITWRETLSFIERMGMFAGASILIVGSGGNGLAFATHASHMNASSVIMVGASRHADTSRRRAGVSVFLDYRADDLQDALREVSGAGFDFIIDAVGRTGIGDRVLPFLRAGGLYATYGLDDFGMLRLDPSRARGSFRIYGGGYDEPETHWSVAERVMQGLLDAAVWYDVARPFSLATLPAAYAAARTGPYTKSLVRIS